MTSQDKMVEKIIMVGEDANNVPSLFYSLNLKNKIMIVAFHFAQVDEAASISIATNPTIARPSKSPILRATVQHTTAWQ
jgi:hypothetical protein